MKKALAALALVFMFLVPIVSGPAPEERFPFSERASSDGDNFVPSDWQDANSGKGDPLLGNLNGLRVASGTSVIDYSHSGYIGIDPPLGWSSDQLEAQLDHLSMWVDDVLVNPTLDIYHEEIWFPIDGHPEYNGDPFYIPDGWTLIKNDAPPDGTEHPNHGLFEFNAYPSDGYDSTMGWRFDANYYSSSILDPTTGVYISQQIPTPWRRIYSAEVSFRYFVSSISDMDDNVFIFTRLEGHVSKYHVYDIDTPTDTWLHAVGTIPSTFFDEMERSDSIRFDIGIGTDIDGSAPTADHELYIDEIEVRLLVRPFPEQIDLLANGAKVTGSTQGSVSPYVPDGSNRDCYSAPDSNGGSGGVDLNGYGNNGWLDVGADVPAYPDWTTAFDYQVGLQFPLHVPQGSAIKSATLQVETPSDSVGLPGMRIYVAAEENVAAFTSGYPLLPDRYDWVNTSVYWRPSTWTPTGGDGGGRYTTPDIAALIQEVVSRPGWQSGNYICIMIDYAYSNQQYTYNQIKGSSGFAQADLARLFVDFIEKGPSDVIPSFSFNKNLVIDHTKVVSDLQDFPVLVDIWDGDLHFDAQADGDDIAFMYNGQILDHEIELFSKQGNGTHAHLICWVKVPHLSSVKDTAITMVYGDEDLGSQENPEGVWDSSYSAVWHLNDNPSQPQWVSSYADYLPHQPQILDSTSPMTHGTTYGTMTSTDSVSGIVGNAIDLEGVNDFVDFGNPTELQMTGAFTVEAWFKADFIDNDYLVVKSGESGYRGWDISFDDDPTISPAGWVMFRFSPDGVNTGIVGYERVDTGQWYHVVGVFYPSTFARFYLNGELVDELTSGVPVSVNDPSYPARIGRRSDNPGGTSYLDAIVDEVRVSAVARSDAWIRTEYNNQRNPELFLTAGEETVNFRYMKDITIDHNKVASDLSGFPVLIDIFDTDLRTDVQADGGDIMFVSNGKSSPHEIELFHQQYNATHAHLITWVKADLSSTTDTVLTMYYGNPSIGNQESPREVWRTDYAGVWHLSESTGNAHDSTPFDLTGTISGGIIQDQAGVAGTCYVFNGINGNVNFGDPTDGHVDFGANEFTYSLWIRIDESTGNYQLPVFKGGTTTSDTGYEMETNTGGTDLKAEVSDGITQEISDSTPITFGQWMYIVAVVDKTSGYLRFYMNGTIVGSPTSISSVDDVSNSQSLQLSPFSYPIDGAIDEFRLISEARTAEWILTEYNNQRDPSGFYSVGIEQVYEVPGEEPIGFAYKKEITIDHNKVDSDLYGFPVLVDVYDTDLRNDVQPDGGDIIFTKDGWIIPHEIEMFDQAYNTSHAHLVAWVKTDLSASSNTILSMYYGNPTLENQEIPVGVWDDSFAAVWHLSEDPIGTVFDSTMNHNYGIGLPSGSEPTLEIGKIDGCAEFYGAATNDRIEAPHTSSLELQSDMLVEAWVRTSNTDGSSDVIVAKWGDVGHRNYWLGKFNDTAISFFVDNTQGVTAPLSLVNDGEWHHVAGVANAASGILFLYVDGIEQASSSYSGTTQTGTSVIQIGNNPGSTGYIQEWDGRIDEVRVSSYYRSSSWIKTEYNNQNDPASFLTVGPEKSSVPLVFSYKKDITIDHTKVGANLNDFPLLIDIFDTDLRTKVQSDGDDIVFKSGESVLPHEIEVFEQSYNGSHAHLVAWVKTDLSSSTDTIITMYYGNPNVPSQENQYAVWNDGYRGVWHLAETSGDALDATFYGTDGTAESAIHKGVSGLIDGAYEFDGPFSNQQVTVGDPADGHLDFGTDSFTVSFWVNFDQSTGDFQLPFYKGGNMVSRSGYEFETDQTGTGLDMQISDGVAHTTSPQVTVDFDSWMYIVGVVDRAQNRLRIYKNGVEVGTGTDIGGIDSLDTTYSLLFCWDWYTIDGFLDEIRISDGAKSAAWIQAEYNNQLDPASFFILGSELVSAGVGFACKKDITIHHTKVNADLNDFPLLIDIFDTDLRTKVQADGDDIIFKSGETKLPHELELFDQIYNSTHAHLVAWVKVDLSSTVDTTISMYYCDPSAGNQESPSDVWNSNFVAVWHMNQDPSSSDIKDSTINGYDLTAIGFGSDQRTYDGKLGTAISVDGIDDRFLIYGISGPINDFTFQSWFVLDNTFPPGSEMYFFRGNSPSNNHPMMRFASSSGSVVTHMEVTSDDDETCVSNTDSWTGGAWYQFAFVRSMSAVRAYHYVNGSLDTADTSSDNANPHLAWDDFVILSDFSGGGMWGSGAISEFRILNVSLSSEWIAAEYLNQNDPSGFYSIGAEISTQPIEFAFKKNIVVDNTKVEADLTDFPLLVDIFDVDLRTKVQPDGDDIVFASGVTVLPHEIEVFEQSYNSSHAHLVAWVKTDLSASTDTIISMYYSNPASGNQQDPANVWDSNYKGVWHLSETPTGAFYDSTSNSNDGTGYNLQSDDQVDGQIDGSIDFDYTNDYINCGNDTSLNVGSNDFSLSLWFKYDGVHMGVLAGKGAVLMAKRYRLSIESGPGMLMANIDDDTTARSISSTLTYGDNLWHHVTMVRDGNYLRLYIDGAEDPNSPIDITGYGSLDEIESFYINAFRSEVGGTLGYWSTANTDEVRVASLALSPERIATEYYNQLDPSSFYSVGEEETVQSIEFAFKKNIVVDHTKVQADLTDFPLLVDIFDVDLRTKVQPDGDDIVFVSSETVLPHEIEVFEQDFNSTHAHLVAWIKTDLSSTFDTTVMMYYGNPEATNRENPTGLWDGNYIGVWHLGETTGGSGSIKDSTSKANHGTDFGNPIFESSGVIGNAIGFNDGPYIQIQDSLSLDSISTGITISAWTRADSYEWELPVLTKGGEDSGAFSLFYYRSTGTNDICYYLDGVSSGTQHTGEPVTRNNWMHVVLTYDGFYLKVYKNGTLASNQLIPSTPSIISNNEPLYIGYESDYSDYFLGEIDEARISTSAKPETWIQTEFNNQYDPASFYSIGEETALQEEYQPEVQITDFKHKKDLIVDHTKVSADLNDFPMLIDIFDTDLRTDVQPDGDDIMFKTGYVWCPHEVTFFDQTYNSTHAHLIAWVKVDLSSSVDTTITMYYGNPSLSAQERPDAVWSNYVGAWHLDGNPSETVYDSSPYNNDGVTLGSMSGSDLVPGQVGNGFELDGIDDMINVSESYSLDSVKYAGTLSLWINWVDSSDGGYQRIMTTSDRFILNPSPPPTLIQDDGFEWAVQLDGDNYFYPWGGDSIDYNLVTNPFTNNIWHHLVLTLDYTTKSVVIYLDGTPLTLAIENVPSQWTQLASLGDWQWGATHLDAASHFQGKFDEIRVANTVRTPEWILTEYINQYDPSSFYSLGAEEQVGAEGFIFTTDSESSVTIGVELSLGVQTTTLSYAEDFSLGTSFSILNGSLPIWTAGVMVSPPSELEAVSFDVSYPEGEWWPFSVRSPSGMEKTFATDWTCFDGKLIVGASAIDEYGMWKIQFLDRNHVLDMRMGPVGGPYSQTDDFSIGENIEYRVWSSGTIGSTISLELTNPSGSTWYSGSTTFQGQRFALPYNHRKTLIISHDTVAENLVNFPVLVDIYDTDLRTDTRSDGRDIAFAIGEDALSHELELFDQTFNSTHAHLVAWVNVPLLSGSTDTVITMYYGNPLAPIVYDSGPVWDAGYLGVWHLGESGTGALNEYLDSSQYKHHGQGGEGNSSFVPTQTTGKIGVGQDFNNLDGYYDLIDCGDSPLWNIDGYQITLEAWIQHDITPNTHVYGIMNHKGWYDGYSLFVNYGGGSTLKPTFSLPGDTHQLRGANDVTGGVWHHIVATYDGSLMRIYVDGIQDPTVLAKSDAILPSAYEQGFWIGHGDQPKDKLWSAEWDGQIDEVRISDVVRSAGWIQTQFENQNDPGGFYSIGVEETIGYSESASINLDSSAPAGVWHATARYSDSDSDVIHRAGMFSRSFIVKRGTSLSLTAPGDAIGDGISTKLVGEQLYVEFELEDTLNAALVSGATVSMNWSVSGIPTQVQFNDYGDGRYGKTLNTSNLGSYGRWRLDLQSSHPFYTDSSEFFYLDLSHRTFLTYEPPPDAPYGDDFEIRLTLKDQFDNAPLTGATIACNATILGTPTDYGNGTYLVTVDSGGFALGEHTFRFTATPSTSYLLSSNIDVQFTYRPIATDATPLSADPVEAPWGQQANTSIYLYDIDHAGIGIEDASISIAPLVPTTFDGGSGYYDITIDVSSLTPGIYFFDLTCSKLNYQSSVVTISVTILAHSTTLGVDYNSTTPVGTDTYFDISWLDLDLDSAMVGSGNLSQVSIDWGAGSTSFPTLSFWLDTSGWAVGSYTINMTINAITSPRFYMDSYIIVHLEIRKLNVYLSWDPLEPFPNGNDFVMYIHVNVSEPGSPIDGTPIIGLVDTYFSATNETGGAYFFKSFVDVGSGKYELTIDSAYFLEGQYKIIVYIDFLISENYTDAHTPQVIFTYRPILAYLSSPDYPTVTTSFDTNVTITLSYIDIDHAIGITTGIITSEGALIEWQHTGSGVYEVLIIVQGLDLGSHEVNITADASAYQAKTLTFQILVQIAYAYARSSVSIIDLPVGDTSVFYADYWDITHDEAIIGATLNHNWTYPLSISWTGDQYRIELPSMNTDALGSYLVIFNFSKGPNYQFGYFNISIILRTHLTEFRLASAIAPTSYNAMVNISVYCGDLDNDAGIIDAPVNLSVYGDMGWIPATYDNDTVLGDGYYIIRFPATTLGPSGIFELTIYFNWTGPVQKYYDDSVMAFVKIIGEASELELIDSAAPTPYLNNLTYIYLYSELYSGNGISNISAPAGNVFIYVEFVGLTFSPSLFTIVEDSGNPGYYSIEFNSTIFEKPGIYAMIVYVNWSKGVDPGYGNRTDSVSVRIIPRNTLVNLIPPESTPYGLNATFSFSFDDVAESTTERIPNGSQMVITIGLPDYSITYSSSTKQFHVSFNTSVLGSPLGSRQFTISVSWTGSPYYANVTGRIVIVNVRFREIEFDYSTISPTSYGDNATLHVTFTDVTLGITQAIDDGSVTLFNGSLEIPVSEYSVRALGNGEYDIELKTTYFSKPGTYSISVRMSTSHFYYATVTASRSLNLRYRLTVLLVEPVTDTPYNNSLEVVFHYSDALSLVDIGNTSTPTTIRIINGSSWLFSSVWQGASEDYLLTIQTYNQVLEINREYVLWIEISYPDSSPFYVSADAYVSFTLRERATNLELTASPEPTQYLENINFTAYYQDSLSLNGIAGATITLTVSGVDLVEGVDYLLQSPAQGIYHISLNTTALGPAGTTASLVFRASWTSDAPYYSTSTLSLSLSVKQRESTTEILSSTTLVKFLENVTFTIRYSDVMTGQAIQLNKDQLLIYSKGTLLQSNEFSMSYLASSHLVSINSSILNVGLVSNWNITFYIDWQDSIAPYYSDGRASAWVTVVNRIGLIIRGTTPTVPIHDNMTLVFTYVDDTTGAGINDAIVLFDCLSPSGLVEGVDFWIFRNAGDYSILVDTTSLGSTGTFTFSLRLLWNPTIVPFYRNTTTIFLQGSVRLIQAQLTNEEPNPSTVPINDNVSVVLNLQDLDHAIPISGAETSFSVVYKTNASGPASWSISPISPGVYELVVDCFDAGVTGTNALIITLSLSDYQTVQIQVPFQIRLRQGELNEEYSQSTFYGEATYVIVELVDKDAGNTPISDAILTIIWPDVGYIPDYTPLGNGQYMINLTTASLDAGLYTLVVGAQKSDYFIADISVPVQILSIPTDLILPETIPDVYWGDDITLWAMFNDTQDNILISGANLVYTFGVLSGSLSEVLLDPGNYSFTVDTGNLGIATTYVVSITATLKNYVTVTGQVIVNVLKLPIALTLVSEAQQEVFKGSLVNITVYVNNTYSNTPLLGAIVTATYRYLVDYTVILSPVPGQNGYYGGLIDTSSLPVNDYVVTIRTGGTNYLSVATSASIKVMQIETVLLLDTLTSTYSTRTFNWSDTIRIGVYVLAPSLNLSFPLSTGISDCIVRWSLSGTAFTGEFLNGTSIGGPGYYYFDFETWDYSASTYTLRLTAYPNIAMFAYSSNLTTLIIQPIETSVESTYLSPKIWGWTGWVNLTYWDLLFDRGIAGAGVVVDWDGDESVFSYFGNGTYQIFINTSLVSPGIYPVSVRFIMDNYRTGTGVFTLTVREVPTSVNVFAPEINQIDGDVLDLQVPYGDILPLILYYNDTWYNRGIPGATELSGVILSPGLQEAENLLIEELAYGNYSLMIDTTRWQVSPTPYTVILRFYLANWSRATIDLQITIINVPTDFQVEGQTSLTLSYRQVYSIWVFYYDNWTGHVGQGIAGASINATSSDTRYVVVSFNQSDPSRPGWYEISVRSQVRQGSAIISIILSKDNYDPVSVSINIAVEPSEFDILISQVIIYGLPIGLILIVGAVLWSRLFSVPKRLRQIRGMVRTISKGKIPAPLDDVLSRQEIVADLFNDIAGPIGITKTASSIPSESIATAVPEIEELLVQLSILTKLTPEELEDFKLDVSKMKLSEQVNFVKEVINQEAIKQGRIERKPMELILEETAAKARAILAGEEIEEIIEPEPVEERVQLQEVEEPEKAVPEPIEFEEVVSTDMLSEDELKEIRKKLTNAGIKGSELETIMDQTRELPRELAEELLKSILGKGGDDE